MNSIDWFRLEQFFPTSLHEGPLGQGIQQDELLMDLCFVIQKPENALNRVTPEEEVEYPGSRHFFEVEHVQQYFIVPEKPFIQVCSFDNWIF